MTFLRLFPLSTLLVPSTNSIIKVGCHYLVNRLSSFEYDEGESSWPSCVGVCFDVYAFNFTKGSKMVSQFLWNNKYNKCTNGKLNFHLFPRYAKRQPLTLMCKDHAILAITYRKTHWFLFFHNLDQQKNYHNLACENQANLQFNDEIKFTITWTIPPNTEIVSVYYNVFTKMKPQ